MVPANVTFKPTEIYRQYHTPPDDAVMGAASPRQSPSPPPVVRPLKLSPRWQDTHSPTSLQAMIDVLQHESVCLSPETSVAAAAEPEPKTETAPLTAAQTDRTTPAVQSPSFNALGNAQTMELCQLRPEPATAEEVTGGFEAAEPVTVSQRFMQDVAEAPVPKRPCAPDARANSPLFGRRHGRRSPSTSYTACVECGQAALWCECCPLSHGSGYVRPHLV
jgi:hypothetical protein|eukprot:COSAG06_NODE_901_length_11650_cov_7.150203_6_plen_220_part_00